METNIDDCSGEMLGFVMEQLLDQGALDVFFTSIFMKKNRPAYRLTVVCNEEKMGLLQKVIFTQTTTIGIRYRKEQRTVLKIQIIRKQPVSFLVLALSCSNAHQHPHDRRNNRHA